MQTACIGQGRFEKNIREFSSYDIIPILQKLEEETGNFWPHAIS